jgi:hypothetical protein
MSPPPNGTFPNRKARALEGYLREELADSDADEIYVKARDIADRLGLSAQEIGACLRQFEDADTDLHVEKWSWSRATTWRVARGE